jgi:hypothetical protein
MMKQKFETSKTIFKKIRCWQWLSMIMIAFLLHSCQGSSDSNDDSSEPAPKTHTSVGFQIKFPDSVISAETMKSSALGAPAKANAAYSDVVRVVVEVKLGDEVLIPWQDLEFVDNQWRGTLENLPIGVDLTFNGLAKDDEDVNIYAGTTTQSLTGEDDNVTIKLSAPDLSITLPRIAQIVIPAEIIVDTTADIQTSVEGKSGEPLNYSFSPAPNGGTFLPASGSILLVGTAGDIMTDYTAPADPGSYQHRVQIANQDNYSISTKFSTKVVYELTNTGVIALFGPSLTAYNGERDGNQITWTIEVSDDKPLDQLKYAWSFEDGGSFPSVVFADPTAKDAVMLNYDETVTGIITLIITDEDRIEVKISYVLLPGQFPDSLVHHTNNTAPVAVAGDDQSVTTGATVNLNASASSDADGDALSYYWSITFRPQGSSAVLSSSNQATTSFVADQDGTYNLTLRVRDGSINSFDTVTVTASTPMTKPTLRLSDMGSGVYRMALLSPSAYEGLGLVGVQNVGVVCENLVGLSGLNGYSPNPPVSIQNNHSISLDVSGSPIAGESMDLYEFQCDAPPSFILGDTVSVTYANTAPITGAANIGIIEP